MTRILGIAALAAVGGLTTVGLEACRDRGLTSEPRAVPPARSATVVGLNDGWDTFAVDITEQTTRLDASGKAVMGQHPLQYHLERHIKNGVTWDLVLTMASRARAAVADPPPNFAPEAKEISRVEDDGDGTPVRLYDGLGRLIARQPIPNLSSNMLNGTGGLTGTSTGGASAKKPSSPVNNRNWLGAFVLTPATTSVRAAALSRQFGQPQRTATGLDEYHAQRDSTNITVDVDPSTAGIRSIAELVGGVVKRKWTMDYDKAADGTATKTQIRVETTPNEKDNGHESS